MIKLCVWMSMVFVAASAFAADNPYQDWDQTKIRAYLGELEQKCKAQGDSYVMTRISSGNAGTDRPDPYHNTDFIAIKGTNKARVVSSIERGPRAEGTDKYASEYITNGTTSWQLKGNTSWGEVYEAKQAEHHMPENASPCINANVFEGHNIVLEPSSVLLSDQLSYPCPAWAVCHSQMDGLLRVSYTSGEGSYLTESGSSTTFHPTTGIIFQTGRGFLAQHNSTRYYIQFKPDMSDELFEYTPKTPENAPKTP